MIYISYLLILIMTLIGAYAGVNLKKASSGDSLKTILTNKYLYLGGILYVIGALINIIVLRYLEYSVVLPLTSVTYIWTMIFSFLLLKEKIGKNKIIGVLLIFTGAVIMALS